MRSFKFAHLLQWSLFVAAFVLSNVARATEQFSEDAQEDHHENYPRFLTFWSKPKTGFEKQTGVGLKHHIGNIMGGGSFGVQAEFGPFAKFHGAFDLAKKYLPPGGFGNIHGAHIRPPPYKPPEREMSDDEEVPIRFEPEGPKKPNKEKPNWDDIGEDDDYQLPVEHLIDPRKRPKRFVESKIYHLPVEFLSNAKPVQVKLHNGDKNQV